MILERLKLIKPPKAEFGDPEAALELRLRPLMPHPDKLESIVNLNVGRFEILHEGMGVKIALKATERFLRRSKTAMIEMRKQDKEDGIKNMDIANVMRSCVNAMVVTTKLSEAYEQHGASTHKHVTVEIPAPQKLMHKAWIVPVISIKK